MASYWLMELGGCLLAVEAAEGLELLSLPALTPLPLSTAGLAGVVLIDAEAVTVIDLAACLGLPPGAPSSTSRLLRFGGEKRGFLVPAPLRSLDREAVSVQSLPAGIGGQEVLGGCLLVDDLPVPLLDFSGLLQRCGEGTSPSREAQPVFPGAAPPRSNGRWRLIQTAGKTFALPEAVFSAAPRPQPAIAPWPMMPQGMAGLCMADGELLPVFNAEGLLGEGGGADGAILLAGQAAGTPVGLLVDAARQEAVAGAAISLPPWGRRPGIEEALWLDGELIPCLRLEGLLGPAPGAGADEEPPPPAGTPGEEWEVTEFSFGGRTHALWREECQDVPAPLPWFPIPGLSPVIEGVAFWKGALWPVANLSPYFGPPRTAAAAGCMIALERGPCRLLLLAERFKGHRRIGSGEQRPLPLHLPHPLVNGCYLDGRRVVLLLDAFALVAHFDAALLQAFQTEMLSPEGRPEKEAACVAPAARECPACATAAAGEGEGSERPCAGPAESPRETSGGENAWPLAAAERMAEEPWAPEEAPGRSAEAATAPGEGDPLRPVVGLGAGEPDPPVERRRAEEGRRPAGPSPEADAATEASGGRIAAPRRSPPAAANQVRRPPRPPRPAVSGGSGARKGRFAAAAFMLAAVAAAGWLLVGEPGGPEPALDAAQPAAAEVKLDPDGDEPATVVPASNPATDHGRTLAAAFPAPPPEEPASPPPRPVGSAPLPPLEFVPPAAAVRAPEPEAVEPPPLPGPAQGSEPYTVKKGDTLWNLSERFLHDPHGYRILARTNSIVDPDVIYPGQVLIVRQGKVAGGEPSSP